MTSITRQQLRDAIEDGINAVGHYDRFTPEDAAALRCVGVTATTVGRGSFTGFDTKGTRCPVAQAFPGLWMLKAWSGTFANAFDKATFSAAGRRADVSVLHIPDDDQTEGEAA